MNEANDKECSGVLAAPWLIKPGLSRGRVPVFKDAFTSSVGLQVRKVYAK